MAFLTKRKVVLCLGRLSKWGNNILNVCNDIVLLLVLCYALFALYDTWSIFRGAGVDAGILKYKPEHSATQEENLSISELSALYPDVRAWLSIDDTKIDYPIVQGTDNLTYVNRNIEGEFSLSGAIFMDCENTADFSDDFNVVYGHHLEMKKMFGGLALFLEQSYLQTHTTGQLFVPNGTYAIEIFAAMSVDAYDDMVLCVNVDDAQEQALRIAYIQENATTMTDCEISEHDRIVALSTCSSEGTNARTVVLAKIIT